MNFKIACVNEGAPRGRGTPIFNLKIKIMDPVKITHIHTIAPTKAGGMDVIIAILALFIATGIGAILGATYVHRNEVRPAHLYRATALQTGKNNILCDQDKIPFTLVLKGEKGYRPGDRVWAIHDTITTMAIDQVSAMPYRITQIIENKD